jgi:hypothetical protein
MTVVSQERFRQVFQRAERTIEERWDVPVVISDVPHPFTGDLDGAQIAIDYDNDAENALFIWCTCLGTLCSGIPQPKPAGSGCSLLAKTSPNPT